MRPVPRGRHDGLRFAEDVTAVPFGDRHVTRAAKASTALDARGEAHVHGARGKTLLETTPDTPGRPGLRIARDFPPEFFALRVGDHHKWPKARLVFVKQRRPRRAQARAVACQDGSGGPLLADAQV